ncbi:hypothetical protein [Roseimaritima multifibrata]|uniref:hypothetical protein n=1 Tax=Roseimaritima multifibrata TaxID=1930274 RepID=UPI001C54D491|nr:hypothetical protein [Roseimaritima multifibrata]
MSNIQGSAARNAARFDSEAAELLTIWASLNHEQRADLLAVARGLTSRQRT